MEKRMKVDINDFSVRKRFSELVNTFESDVNIIKGSLVFDAKSILAIVNIDPRNDTYVEIVSNDKSEISRFMSEMEEFKYD